MLADSSQPMPTDDQWAAIALEVAQEAGLDTSAPLRRLDGGAANHVYRLDERWVVRLGTGPDGECFPKSAGILRALAGTMAAPRVVYSDVGKKRWPCNVMVCTYMPGRSLFDLWKQMQDADRMGVLAEVPAQLGVLHSLPCDSVPCFCSSGPWAAAMRDRLDRAFDTARGLISDAWWRRMRRFVESNGDALEAAPRAVITHNDVHWNNIIVHEGRLAGLVDFDDAEVAPAEIDAWGLAHLLAYSDRPQDLTPLSRPDRMRWAFVTARRMWPGALDAAGMSQRYVIARVENILTDWVSPPPWHTAEECRQEAQIVYHAMFELEDGPAWLEAR